MPYICKAKVLQACLSSALLYGSESWFSTDVKKISSMYLSAVKAMLGVRNTTANDLALAECGLPSLAALVRERQVSFFRQIQHTRAGMVDDPLMYVFDMARTLNTRAWRYLRGVLNCNNPINEDRQTREHRIRARDSTKFRTYCALNRHLKPLDIYTTHTGIQEHKRIELCRFRLSSHNLKVETGRWARIPLENRLCDCESGGVQDEEHVVAVCAKLTDLRTRYDVLTFEIRDFFSDPIRAADFIFEAMKLI